MQGWNMQLKGQVGEDHSIRLRPLRWGTLVVPRLVSSSTKEMPRGCNGCSGLRVVPRAVVVLGIHCFHPPRRNFGAGGRR